MDNCKKNAALFGVGAVGYSLLELAVRGHTHWTMTLTGGVCAVALYHAHKRLKSKNIWIRCGAGAAIITAAELAVGIVVNRMLKWNVWDYSDRFLNVLGQICPRFSAYWFLLNLPLILLFRGLDEYWFEKNEKRIKTSV